MRPQITPEQESASTGTANAFKPWTAQEHPLGQGLAERQLLPEGQ